VTEKTAGKRRRGKAGVEKPAGKGRRMARKPAGVALLVRAGNLGNGRRVISPASHEAGYGGEDAAA